MSCRGGLQGFFPGRSREFLHRGAKTRRSTAMGYSSTCRQLQDRWHGWGVSILRLDQGAGQGRNKTAAEMR